MRKELSVKKENDNPDNYLKPIGLEDVAAQQVTIHCKHLIFRMWELCKS